MTEIKNSIGTKKNNTPDHHVLLKKNHSTVVPRQFQINGLSLLSATENNFFHLMVTSEILLMSIVGSFKASY